MNVVDGFLFHLLHLVKCFFGSGDAEKDAASMRIFVKDGHDIAVAQSYAKNFGLYGERIGCFRWACFPILEMFDF